MGIEPTSSAWKAEVLAFELHPQNQYRVASIGGAKPILLSGGAEKSRSYPDYAVHRLVPRP